MKTAFNAITKVCVTGSKGKTTVVHMLNAVLESKHTDILRVDSMGSYFNNKQSSTFDDSIKHFGFAPNVMPGRYIFWHLSRSFDYTKKCYALLETGIGSSRYGIGSHVDIGIFTNVFAEHVNKLHPHKKGIYSAKLSILRNLSNTGILIAHIDDTYTKNSFKDLVKKPKQKFIGISRKKLSPQSLKKIMQHYHLDEILYIDQNFIITSTRFGGMYDLKNFLYFNSGHNRAMIDNALFAAAVFSTTGKSLIKLQKALDAYKLPEEYGRQATYTNGKQHITLDYAHEPQSLSLLVLNLFLKFKQATVVITRASHVKTAAEIKKFARMISKIEHIDCMYLYDSLSSADFKTYYARTYRRDKGETVRMLAKYLQEYSPSYPFQIIEDEQQALQTAISKKHTNIAHIVQSTTLNLKLLKELHFKRVG